MSESGDAQFLKILDAIADIAVVVFISATVASLILGTGIVVLRWRTFTSEEKSSIGALAVRSFVFFGYVLSWTHLRPHPKRAGSVASAPSDGTGST